MPAARRRSRISPVGQQALSAAGLFGSLGLGGIVLGALHFVGVVKAETGYGVLWCVGGALFLWLAGRVVYGIWRETRVSDRSRG
jgi:hypothetical protein